MQRMTFRQALTASLGLGLLFALAVSAHGQCNPGRVFDDANLSLGAALGSGNCPGGNCQQPAAPLPAPLSSGAASASAIAGPQAYAAPTGDMQAIVAAVIAQMHAQGLSSSSAASKPLYMSSPSYASSASSTAAAASAMAGGPVYAPPAYNTAPAPVALSYQVVPLAAPTIPVALANVSNASTASATSGGGGCGGGRGFFRRGSRTRTRTVAQSGGSRSVSTSTSVSR